MCSICSFILESFLSTSISPASIFEISTISLMILSIRAPLFSIILIYSCCSSPERFGSFNSSEKPRIPFIGVRISWLILARKADFKRSLFSAISFASIRSAIMFFFSVISSFMAMKEEMSPLLFRMGDITALSQNKSPFFFLFWNSPVQLFPDNMVFQRPS